MSYSVTQRTTEIGIRMALGADRTDVIRLILRQAGFVTVCGLVAGIAGALLERTDDCGFRRGSRRDRILAALVPECRASQLDPVSALKLE